MYLFSEIYCIVCSSCTKRPQQERIITIGKVLNTIFRRIEINFWNVVIENVDIRGGKSVESGS
jgi:hypothetical protein